jgi:FSR family fosmidomycin resistance protein-like MFS transporter
VFAGAAGHDPRPVRTGGRGECGLSLVTALPGMVDSLRQRRTMAVACSAHALHDGFTDVLYVLLPLWQAEFGLGYAEIGILRALYAGSMAGFQVPAGLLAARVGGPALLAAGTALAGIGYLVAGASAGFAMLTVALVVGGLGSSVQHPIASDLVARSFAGQRSRRALATYNFSGDLGKMALPAATAGLVAVMPWRSATSLLGIAGLAAAVAILLLRRGLPNAAPAPAAETVDDAAPAASGRGFPLLLAIGILDSATRMGFLTFLPFLLRAKGADLPVIGVALSLIFAGGAAGKLACGFLGARLGVVPAIFLTEGLTAAGILILLPLSLMAALVVLPLVGIVLNGTSSVLYGTVPELVAADRRARAFSIFYTGTVGAGALSPALYGLVSDAAGVSRMMVIVAGAVLLTLPLSWALRPALRRG